MQLKQNGFSFMEVLSAMALIGIIVIGAMSVSKIQSQSTQGAQGAIDLAKAMASIDALVREPAWCSRNLSSITVGTDTAVIELKDQADETIFKEGEPFYNGAYLIKAMKVGNVESDTGRTEFKVTFKKNKDVKGVTEIEKVFYFYPNINPTTQKIEDCNFGIRTQINSLLARFCDDLYGQLEAPCDYTLFIKEAKKQLCDSRPWLVWNGAIEKCEILDASKSCVDKYIAGYDVNGDVVCSTIGSGPASGCYEDADGDSFGDPAKPAACEGTNVANNSDCCDSDALANPGQTNTYTTPNACGSFDYNCDGVLTKNNSGSFHAIPALPAPTPAIDACYESGSPYNQNVYHGYFVVTTTLNCGTQFYGCTAGTTVQVRVNDTSCTTPPGEGGLLLDVGECWSDDFDDVKTVSCR